MAVSDIGKPFQGKAWYWVEATYGAGESGSTLPISKYIQDVRIGSGDRHAPIRDIGDPALAALLEQCKDPTLHLEYNPQCDDTLIEDVGNRDACGELQSLAFLIGVNTCTSNAADDKSYYLAKGCKPSTVRIASSKNEPYSVTIDFEAQSVATSTTATGSEPSALSGAILQFNVAGSITKTGGFNPEGSAIAYITNSIDITIDHQLSGYTDHDALEKSFLVEGELNVSGSCDITLDGGGAMHFGEVFANTPFTIVVNLGGAGCPQLTLTGCEWDSSEIDVNVSGEAVMESAPFTAVPTDKTAIVGST